MTRKATGIRRRRGGWRVVVRVHGRLYTKQFALETPIATMQAWRQQQVDRVAGSTAGAFAADVDDYLSRVAAMPSYRQRAAHLALWLAALGRDRPRHTITPAEIDRVLQDWLRTLSPVTVRKRRTALQSLFVTLDGTGAPNPVRAAANPRVPPPEPRGLDYATIAKILAAMPDQQDVAPGTLRRPALGKLRAAVLAYTGIPPCALQALTPLDVDWTAKTLRLVARRKGRGAAARTVPLTADGLTALRAFHAAKAYGPFATEALNRSFKRAARRVGVDPRVRLYDLRHSFGRELYRLRGDLATVARFLGHAPGSTVTARYAEGANAAVDAAAATAFDAARATERRALLPKKLPAAKKRRVRKRLRKAS